MPAKRRNGRRNSRGTIMSISSDLRSLSAPQCLEDVGGDVFAGLEHERTFGQPSQQVRDLSGWTKVGVGEGAGWFEHSGYLGDEGGHRGIAVGRLDIDHQVEGVVRKGHGLGVALDEPKSRASPVSSAQLDRSLCEVHPGHRSRSSVSG